MAPACLASTEMASKSAARSFHSFSTLAGSTAMRPMTITLMSSPQRVSVLGNRAPFGARPHRGSRRLLCVDQADLLVPAPLERTAVDDFDVRGDADLAGDRGHALRRNRQGITAVGSQLDPHAQRCVRLDRLHDLPLEAGIRHRTDRPQRALDLAHLEVPALARQQILEPSTPEAASGGLPAGARLVDEAHRFFEVVAQQTVVAIE